MTMKYSDKLPLIRKKKKQIINKKELLTLAEKVRVILKKEGRLVKNDGNFSFKGNPLSW